MYMFIIYIPYSMRLIENSIIQGDVFLSTVMAGLSPIAHPTLLENGDFKKDCEAFEV